MTLLYPTFLWLLIPLLVLFFKGTKHLLFRVHLLILLLLVLSLSRPVKEEVLQSSTINAKDIIIALDVSYSMRANDLKPSRYTFGVETIHALLDANPSDNIMLIAFTSNPLLLSPPTTDHALIKVALKSLNRDYILTKGTSLKNLFTKLSHLNTTHKNLVLITDGGEEKDSSSLAQLLQKANLSLVTLALGSNHGATVIKKDGSLLKDKEGNLVVSRMNPILETLTTAVEGRYITASLSAKRTAEDINHALETQQTQKSQKLQRHYLELYQIPLLLATLLFLLVHTRGIKYLITLFSLLGFHAEASMLDFYHLTHAYEAYEKHDFNKSKTACKHIDKISLQSQILLGDTYYKMGAFKKAIETYNHIRTTSRKTKQHLYYNIANAYAQQGAYSKAKIYFTKALQLGMDEDSKHNLNIVSLLADKKAATLGIAHPKSQGAQSSKSDMQDEKEKNSKSEDQSSAGSGAGGESKEKKKQESSKLLSDNKPQKQPLSSKVYELINKGYIRETRPW